MSYQNLHMRGLPWMNDIVLPLAQYYVDLSLKIMDKTGLDYRSRPIKIEDVFSPELNTKIPSRILIEGDPGTGKTTLAAKLAFDWANQVHYIHHFDIVVLIPLRHCVGKLQDVISHSISFNERDNKRVFQLLEDKSKHILLIMDGYDEITDEMKTVILPLLQQKVYAHTTVILTSRPVTFITKKEMMYEVNNYSDLSSNFHHFIQKRVKVEGLSSKQQETFIRQHTRNYSTEETQNITTKLDLMVEKDFTKCPLFLLMFIVTFSENLNKKDVLKSKTELYKQVSNCVVRRYFSKTDHCLSEIDLFSHIGSKKPPHIELMEEFGKFSLWALSTNLVSFSFEEIVKNSNGDAKILEVGFFTQSITVKRLRAQVVYTPVHRSLLGFFAAYALWIAFVDGSYQRQQWNDCVMSVTPILNESLCFSFLLGLMAENADIVFNALLPNRWKYSLEFYNWKSSLLEMKSDDSALKALSPFLPPIWKYSELQGEDQHKSIVQWGIKEGTIKQIEWDCHLDLLVLTNFAVDTLVLERVEYLKKEFTNKVSMSKGTQIQCKNLWCNFGSYYDAEAFKHALKVIDLEHLSISLEGIILPGPVDIFTKDVAHNKVLNWIKVNVSFNTFSAIDQVIELILGKKVTRLALGISNDNLKMSFISLHSGGETVSRRKVIQHSSFNNLISAAASSSLGCFTLVRNMFLKSSKTTNVLEVDLADLCNGGQKSWEWVHLEGVKVECRSEIMPPVSIICLELPVTDVSEKTICFIEHCHVKSLTCSASLLASCIAYWPLFCTLTELYIAVDKSVIQHGLSNLLRTTRNLQILGLIMLQGYVIVDPVEEWLFGSLYFLCLKGIEIWETEQNNALAKVLIAGIVQCLQANNSHSSLLPAFSMIEASKKNTLRLQYLMLNGMNFTFHVVNHGILKHSLVEQRLLYLEIVPNAFEKCESNRFNPLSDLSHYYPFDEGFRINYDIWGYKKDDTIKSQMMNDRDPGLVKRFCVSYEQKG